MSLSVHTNQSSLTAQRSLNSTQLSLNNSQQRLSTGLRINSAKDDAAGLQIANRMESQTRGLSVAQRNAADGISMSQTAEGALKEVSNILQRQRELALQAANGTNSADDKDALNKEFTELNAELGRIKETTTFAGNKLFGGSGALGGSGVSFQVGADTGTGNQISVAVNTDAAFTVSGSLGASGDPKAVVASIDTALKNVGGNMAQLGALQNRFQSTINNLSNIEENVSVAKGRIMDADIAKESANMTKQNMMMQAGISVLSQANQTPSMIMGLLR
ncbi:flagellin [Plesiomonas shigelloides]|uniref:flagellin N-terminal helical domain-containing protein n=1 Tax=Plesiomonas shigelloides TaxID=703 RepID=UPI001C5B10E9|nr:flagellin [Plesiomonas shigelloides]MBW3792637.1 flagellin FliC [Plesiomonas shigelloides]